MPIKIPNMLPATRILNDENIFVITETRAVSQDIRPLKLLVLNLMPNKIETETQLARLLGNTPLQVELTLIHTKSHQSKNTAEEHLFSFYKTFDDIKTSKFDGMVVTGAPVEMIAFEEVDYWQELTDILEWAKTNVTSSFFICWAAQAALYYYYGIEKHVLPKKMFGIFEHEVVHKKSILFRGFDEKFYVPHSRHTGINEEAVAKNDKLKILAKSEEAGIYVIATDKGKQIFVTGHSEYDRDTLKKEYLRDKSIRDDVELPKNYFPDDDETKDPIVNWKSYANLLYSNWLNYFVYQTTPYDISKVGSDQDLPIEDGNE